MINIVKAKDPVLDEFCARPAFPEQAEKAAREAEKAARNGERELPQEENAIK